ncbi:MAG: hypothetical protein Salg2KO_23150 [Salibacteraceae bacterium]
MHFIAENLKYLRKQHNWTQGELAHHLGVKRSMIGAYEEGRADPKISLIQLICQKFNLNLDAFISSNLNSGNAAAKDLKGKSLRILPITIEHDTKSETATLVPVKAAAGYLDGYGDVEFIEQLPTFRLPFPELPKGKTYRLFQIKGDSMLPVEADSYVICTYVMDWETIKNDECYVLVTQSDGIVFKRVLNNISEGCLTLKSDNPAYTPYSVPINDVMEVWKAEGITRIGLPEHNALNYNANADALAQVNERLDRIEQTLKTK